MLLDQIVRSLGLTTIDANDRDVSLFPAGCVPMVHIDSSVDDSPDRKCTCIPVDSAQPPNPFTSWSYILPWDPAWNDSQIRDEECRRLCWSALNLICSYISQCAAFDIDPPEFYLSNSGNVSNFYITRSLVLTLHRSMRFSFQAKCWIVSHPVTGLVTRHRPKSLCGVYTAAACSCGRFAIAYCILRKPTMRRLS